MKSYEFFVYMTASFSGILYIGVTNNLARRMYEHKNHLVPDFTAKYKCTKLLYFEKYSSIEEAIQRKKQLKNWRREKKIKLIKKIIL